MWDHYMDHIVLPKYYDIKLISNNISHSSKNNRDIIISILEWHIIKKDSIVNSKKLYKKHITPAWHIPFTEYHQCQLLHLGESFKGLP